MLRVARETGLSETTFVQAPTAAGADYRNRIFTTRGELPFAGHPTIGTAAAEALRRGDRQATYTQQTPSGLVRVEVDAVDGRTARASVVVGPATFGDEVEIDADLHPDPDPALPAQLVATGVTQLIAPVRSLDHPWPSFDALEALLGRHGALALYWLVADGEHAHARSFALDPDTVIEDAATGSAAAPALAYLHERTGVTRLTVDQGEAMGRPSRLECAVEDGGRIRLGGEAVVVLRGTLDA